MKYLFLLVYVHVGSKQLVKGMINAQRAVLPPRANTSWGLECFSSYAFFSRDLLPLVFQCQALWLSLPTFQFARIHTSKSKELSTFCLGFLLAVYAVCDAIWIATRWVPTVVLLAVRRLKTGLILELLLVPHNSNNWLHILCAVGCCIFQELLHVEDWLESFNLLNLESLDHLCVVTLLKDFSTFNSLSQSPQRLSHSSEWKGYFTNFKVYRFQFH